MAVQERSALKLSAKAALALDSDRTLAGEGDSTGAPCHAPMTSMYFHQTGLVLACCMNLAHPLGRWPDQSVMEIWQGPEAQSLRDALNSGDLGLGCQGCHMGIEVGNLHGVHRQFDRHVQPMSLGDRLARRRYPKWPRSLEFALSTKCNLECTMCSPMYSTSIAKRAGVPTTPEMYGPEFVDEITPFLKHVEITEFYGGEPFLVDRHHEIWERLVEVNPKSVISVTTNGTVLTDRVRAVLEASTMHIVLSLDAATASTYEGIRVNGDFDKVMAHLDVFQTEAASVSLTCCPMIQNWHEMPALLEEANRRDLGIGFNTVTLPLDHSLRSLQSEELADVIGFWRSAEIRRDTPGCEANAIRFESVIAQVEAWADKGQAVSGGVPVSLTASTKEVQSSGPHENWIESWLAPLGESAGSGEAALDMLLSRDGVLSVASRVLDAMEPVSGAPLDLFEDNREQVRAYLCSDEAKAEHRLRGLVMTDRETVTAAFGVFDADQLAAGMASYLN